MDGRVWGTFCEPRLFRVLLTSGLLDMVFNFRHVRFNCSLNTFLELTWFISRFGFVNSWGVFQAYYEQTLLSDTSPSTM